MSSQGNSSKLTWKVPMINLILSVSVFEISKNVKLAGEATE